MPDDIDDRIRRIEYAIWGLRGDNGMVSDVRQLRAEFQAYIADERHRRDKLSEIAQEAAVDRRRERVRNTFAAVAISVTFIGSVTTTILTILG